MAVWVFQIEKMRCCGKLRCLEGWIWSLMMIFCVCSSCHGDTAGTFLKQRDARSREFGMDDLSYLVAALYAQPHVTDFIELPYAYAQEREYEQNYIERIYGFCGFGMWLVFEKKQAG